MSERRGERGDESYDWLYGGADRPDDATVRLPRPAPRQSARDPEPTQVISAGGSGGGSATGYQPPPGSPAGGPPGQRPPGQPAYTAPPSRPPPRRRRWPKLVLLVLLAWVAFLVAVPIWAWAKIAKVDAEPGGNRPADTSGTTYLLVGSDSREELTERQRQRLGAGDAAGQRADTIILLHVPGGSGPTLLLSIPRDSFVEIPGQGTNKVNAAYAFGGPELLVQTVEQATDLRVDGYVEIGFGGFVNIVDAVGGIRICPESAMRDPKANLDLRKGCQQVDGTTALGYVRSRQTDALGDIGRAGRQREVVGAVASKAASPLTPLLPWRYVSVASSGADAFRIGEDVGPFDLARFAWAVARVGGSGLTCTVPIADPGAVIGGVSYVTWNEAAAERLFRAIAQDRTDAIDCSPTGT